MKNKLTIIGLLFAVAAAGFGLVGCGDQATSPINGTNNGLNALLWSDSYGADQSGGGQPSAAVENSDFDASSVTPLQGGLVELQLESGSSTLSVPSGAVRVPVVVTALATQLKTPFGTITLYEFGPAGLKFEKAATLTLAVGDPEGSERSLYWYNPDSDQWEVQESCVVKNGAVQFSVYHFSKYGIS